MSGDYLVRDFMTAPVKSISHKARLLDAALVLRSKGIRHLPIVDGDRLVGIITDLDVERFAPSLLSKITPEEYNAIFENTPLERVMTHDPMTIAPDTPLREAAGILYEQKLGCLPVVEKARLVGILTVTDLLGVLVQLLNGTDPRQSPDEDV